ncbi:hypothetical protein RB195_014065 [Necator americanus]|uniref:Uncharacterized protein n=1 Tax=Necator americanus TaxID=51031 RepID=A0ABR1DYY7_NECAM
MLEGTAGTMLMGTRHVMGSVGQRVPLRDRPAHDNGLGSPMHHCRAPGPLREGAAGIGGGTQGRLPGSGGALRWASHRKAA